MFRVLCFFHAQIAKQEGLPLSLSLSHSLSPFTLLSIHSTLWIRGAYSALTIGPPAYLPAAAAFPKHNGMAQLSNFIGIMLHINQSSVKIISGEWQTNVPIVGEETRTMLLAGPTCRSGLTGRRRFSRLKEFTRNNLKQFAVLKCPTFNLPGLHTRT